ncbi:MAG: hypothetical protein COV67_07940, partial [Nitrospinae bacterium CG11_big_fil_rev_8_21_14_0_20_56_8]
MKTVFAAFFSLTVVGGPFNAHAAPQYLGTHCPELSKLELHLKSSKLTVPAIEKNDPYKTQNLDRPPFSHCHAPIWYELMIQKDGTKHFNDLSSREQIEAIRAEEGRFQNISSEYRKLLQIVYSIEYALRK